MIRRLLQVLAPSAIASILLLLPCVVRAQPPEVVVPGPTPSAPLFRGPALPIEPLKLEDWLASRGGMTTLKLQMDGAKAAAIAAEVQRQSGIPIAAMSGMEQEPGLAFSVEATGQPFWEAISQWNRGQRKLHLGANWAGENGDALFVLNLSTAMPEGRGLPLGPLYLVASSVSVSNSSERSVAINAVGVAQRAPTVQAQNNLRLQSSLFIDPKLAGDIAGVIAEVERVADDQGRVIAMQPHFGTPTGTMRPRGNEPIDLTFITEAPRQGARRLSLLRGVMRLAVVTKREKWEIDPRIMGPQEKKFQGDGGEVMLRFNRLRVGENHSTAYFRIERRAGRRGFALRGNTATFELGGFNDTLAAMRAFNAEGRSMPASGGGGNGGLDGGIDIEASFPANQNNLDPEENTLTRIVIDLPLEWREVQIPFEIKDLPLP